jgi:uroporphyrinogen decarboxylase
MNIVYTVEPSPDFNRLRRALMLEGEGDRVPIAEVYVDPYIKELFLAKPVQSLDDLVEFYYRAGYDYVELRQGFGILMGEDYSSDNVSATEISYTRASGKDKPRRKRTWAHQHIGVIKDAEALDNYLWPRVEDFDFSEFENIKGILPDGMKVIAVGGKIFSVAWELMGFENLCLSIITNVGLVQKLMERIASIQLKVFEVMAGFEVVGAMWLADDLAHSTGLMVSPQFFRKHLFPWFIEYKKICEKYSLPLIYHSDGCILEVIEDLIDCGINALHPIEPKAMDIYSLKEEYGNRLCLIGNIDVGETLARGTPEAVEEEVRQKIFRLAPGGGYCIGSSNAITDYVSLENYVAMLEASFKYGRYPINERSF